MEETEVQKTFHDPRKKLQLFERGDWYENGQWNEIARKHKSTYTGRQKKVNYFGSKLTDFDKLLSHHDERQASGLDTQYLKEEWDFGHEKLGKKSKFTTPPVIYGETRVELDTCLSDYYTRTHDAMIRSQKENYRQLRSAVGSSQGMVYRVKSGFVRQRPLTAPHLSRYTHTDDQLRRESIRTQSIQQKMENLLKLAVHQQGGPERVMVDTSDKPVPVEYKRCQTPKVVSDSDLEETEQKVKELCFNMETEKGRHYIMTETAIDFYIPKYKDKWLEKKNQETLAQPIHKKKKKISTAVSSVSREDIVYSLAYPEPHLPPSHAKRCDARFRGWHVVRSKKGPHYILASPYYTNTTKGQVERSVHARGMNQIRKVRSDLLFRFTPNDKIDSRPITAPAVLEEKVYEKQKCSATSSSGYWSFEDKHTNGMLAKSAPEAPTMLDPTGLQMVEDNPEVMSVNNRACVNKETKTSKTAEPISVNTLSTTEVAALLTKSKADFDHADNMDYESSSGHGSMSPSPVQQLNSATLTMVSRSKSETDISNPPVVEVKKTPETRIVERPRSKSYVGSGHNRYVTDKGTTAPMPHMEHKKPRLVLVGNMGQIKLLENIREAPFWEELSVEQQRESESSEYESSDTDSHVSGDLKASEKLKKKKKKKRVRKFTSNDERILSMIIAEEKSRVGKEKKALPQSKEAARANSPSKVPAKSSSNHGLKQPNREVGHVGSVPSEGSAGSKPSSPAGCYDDTTYPKSSSQIGKYKSTIPRDNLPSPISVDNLGSIPTHDKVKHVVIVGHSVENSPRTKRQPNKYERLVKRMEGGISDRLSKRLLSNGPTSVK